MTAWQLLARAPAKARAHAEAILAQKPGDFDATLLLAASLRRLDDVAGAHGRLAPLMAARPRVAVAWFEWGLLRAAMGDEAGAAIALREAVAIEPRFAGAWRALGDALMVLGDGPGAGDAYARAAEAGVREPRLAGAARALAEGRLAQAAALLDAAGPSAAGLHLRAEVLTRQGQVLEAEAVLGQVVAAAPGFGEARHSLAILLYTQRRFGEAAAHVRALLGMMAQQPSLRWLLAVCLMETGDADAAIPLFEAMLTAWPAQPKTLLSLAHALKSVGRADDAEAAYRACIALSPAWAAGAWLSLADMKTMALTDADVAAMQRLAAQGGDVAQAQYALGRAFEQRGDFARAFAAFAAGARARRAAIAYDPGAVSAYRAACAAAFAPDAPRAAADGFDAPIFVVGMPRAGSSLVEQILASHPDVEGVGELTEIGAIAADLQGGRGLAALPAIVAGLDDAAAAALGVRYLARTQQFRRLGRPRFVDKMPDNFLHAALIARILPGARIVDVRRAPMAAGMAAFKQYFQPRQTGQDYSYDLGEIGRYLRDYVALMALWDVALPGRVHLVRYEALVGDTEAEVRRLLAVCGLAFAPACLRFWETPRTVQTPSAQQVRQPVHTGGLEHWRHYEPWLGPLRAVLGGLA